MRNYFLSTGRIGFSLWQDSDLSLAKLLWGDPCVTQFICASGRFSERDIEQRLQTEIENYYSFKVQYWPLFDLASNNLIGCCGLRPGLKESYELGFHLRPQFWHKGLAFEAANEVIKYAAAKLKVKELIAGHHPHNLASQKVLLKLGFKCMGTSFYKPTGLMHPSYKLLLGDLKKV
ncbi:GNAT family N-acetyltransferase [Succinatimonas hippei]|uniref:GNAT family N-acetyltransferase n=1 Tax=Succinatimonas hippei TaxID=626938 RepID=UPI0020138727|nr:GNAT family N-acetyltransferase [Succinatimonas hippei]MCL1602934.1 GNAT family N-acetyltransferase [Succinatimonas hippei]